MSDTETTATKPPETQLAPPAAEKNAPNIMYVRKKRRLNKETGKLKTAPVEADMVPTFRKNGSKEYKLPDGETQLAGFFHEDAAGLIRAWPKDFKPLKAKGGK